MIRENFGTFVFFDIETTGLPDLEFNKTKITELALVACSKVELQKYVKGTVPRVVHKLTVCFNPSKMISPDSSKITGLDNYNLEKEKTFSTDTGQLIEAFFNQLLAPICLVAHNGYKFDYPILRKQLEDVGVSMENIFCVDSLEIFKDIHDSAAECSVEPVNSTPDEVLAVEKTESSDLAVLLSSDIQARQRLNERTPSARKVKVEESKIRLQEISNASGVRVGSKSKRALFPADDKCVGASSSKKRVSFKLVDIYARLHGAAPAVAHNAEEDAINLMKCFLAVKEQFIERAEATAKELMAIKPLGRK